MKVEVSDECIDEIVAKTILETIQGTYTMCIELLDEDELESYQMQDLAQGLKDLEVLKGAYKYFSPVSEHIKIEGYTI